MTKDKDTSENGMDWDHRILCSDESCIGIIGMDGRCRECGKIFKGKLPENFGVTVEDEAIKPELGDLDSDELLDMEESAEDEEMDNGGGNDNMEPDWEKRILCRDENCIGVIGPDGKCKECGKPYEKDK